MSEWSLHHLWDRLCRLRSLSFVANSGAASG